MSTTEKTGNGRKSAYRTPTATPVGTVEELTAGGSYNYRDNRGYKNDKNGSDDGRTREI